MDCAICPVRVRTEWFDLDESGVESLNSAKVRREYAPGTHVFTVGEPCRGLYYIAAGLIANLRRYRDGATGGLLTFRHPGDVLGLRSFLSDGPHLATAKAVQPSVVCFIDGETVHSLLGRAPRTMLQFVRRLAGSLECAEEKLADPGADGMRRRVLRLIAALRLACGRTDRTGDGTIELPLPRADIAAAVGASPRALTNVLARLEGEGLIASGPESLRVLDPRRLHAAVRDDPSTR
ncbi:MAG: Crp/Fnr family transcriptional regulator [Rhodospirillales bacterium]